MRRIATVMLLSGWTALVLGAGGALADSPPASVAGVEDETDEVRISGPDLEEPEAQVAPSTTVSPAPASGTPSGVATTQALPRPSFLRRMGVGVMLGGGVTDFTNASAQDVTSTGGFWDVRVIFGGRAPLGFEAGYVGAAQGLNGSGLGSSPVLIRNGVEGVARLNLILAPMRQVVIPFFFSGIGWMHQSLSDLNGSGVTGLESGDNGMTVPVGGGLAFEYKGGYFDGRFTYRPVFFNDSTARLDTWSAGANVGYLF